MKIRHAASRAAAAAAAVSTAVLYSISKLLNIEIEGGAHARIVKKRFNYFCGIVTGAATT